MLILKLSNRVASLLHSRFSAVHRARKRMPLVADQVLHDAFGDAGMLQGRHLTAYSAVGANQTPRSRASLAMRRSSLGVILTASPPTSTQTRPCRSGCRTMPPTLTRSMVETMTPGKLGTGRQVSGISLRHSRRTRYCSHWKGSRHSLRIQRLTRRVMRCHSLRSLRMAAVYRTAAE